MRLAAQAQQARAEVVESPRVDLMSAPYLGAPSTGVKSEGGKRHDRCNMFVFCLEKENAGYEPAFSFIPPKKSYGVLGPAGAVVAGAEVLFVPKLTTGGASVPAAASKYVRGFAPVTFAVIACGKVRM